MSPCFNGAGCRNFAMRLFMSFLVISVNVGQAAAWSESGKLPLAGRWETVVSEGVLAGSTMQMRRLISARSVQALLEEARGNWQTDERIPQLSEQRAGWSIVSRWREEGVETLQIRAIAGGGSEAWFVRSAARREHSSSRAFADSLMPAAFKRLHALESRDPHAHNVTLIGTSPESFDRAWSQVQAALSERQFKQQPGMSQARLPAGVRSALLANRTHEVAVTLDARNGPLTLVMHVREAIR